MGKWGESRGIILCSVTGLIAGALVCAAQNVAMFIVFKFVAGLSSWVFVTVSMLILPPYHVNSKPLAL